MKFLFLPQKRPLHGSEYSRYFLREIYLVNLVSPGTHKQMLGNC